MKKKETIKTNCPTDQKLWRKRGSEPEIDFSGKQQKTKEKNENTGGKGGFSRKKIRQKKRQG